MFIALLLATTLVSALIAYGVAKVFDKPLHRIFERIIRDQISAAWVRYIKFATYVVGITSGVRIWQLDRYITPADPAAEVVALTNELWSWEIFRTLLGALQGITWMLLVVFLFALVAYVVVRALEVWRARAA